MVQIWLCFRSTYHSISTKQLQKQLFDGHYYLSLREVLWAAKYIWLVYLLKYWQLIFVKVLKYITKGVKCWVGVIWNEVLSQPWHSNEAELWDFLRGCHGVLVDHSSIVLTKTEKIFVFNTCKVWFKVSLLIIIFSSSYRANYDISICVSDTHLERWTSKFIDSSFYFYWFSSLQKLKTIFNIIFSLIQYFG